MILVMVVVAGPFAIIALGCWGLAPLFEREVTREATPRLPQARVGRGRVDWEPAPRAPLTWGARARVTFGLVCALAVAAMARALLVW